MGLDAAVRVAHAMEDCFVAAQKGKLVLGPEQVDILLQGVDLLIEVAQLGEAELEAWQSEHEALLDALVADLTSVKEGQTKAHREPKPADLSPSSLEQSPALSSVASSAHHDEIVVGPDRSADSPSVQPNVPLSPVVAVDQNRGAAVADLPSPSPVPDRDRDRVVRVTAESLTRLMGLAGEALVQTHRLSPLVDALWQLRGRETGLLKTLQLLEDGISSRPDALTATDRDRLASAKAQASQGLQKLGETVECLMSLPASVKPFPVDCTMKCWPVECGP